MNQIMAVTMKAHHHTCTNAERCILNNEILFIPSQSVTVWAELIVVLMRISYDLPKKLYSYIEYIGDKAK